jgi:ribonuclease HI
MGIVLGSEDFHKISLPITNLTDTFALRTNQRAELLAAIQGVELAIADKSDVDVTHPSSDPNPPRFQLVIATDSNYVVQGMTE